MEIEGHPTQDMVEELQRRGALRIAGSVEGPSPDATRFLQERLPETEGYWLFVPTETYQTGFDEPPGG